MNVKERSYDTIFHLISNQFCICDTDSSVHTVWSLPFDFDTNVDFFCRSHGTILIRLSDGNKSDFNTTFWFDFRHSIFLSKACLKQKSDGQCLRMSNRKVWRMIFRKIYPLCYSVIIIPLIIMNVKRQFNNTSWLSCLSIRVIRKNDKMINNTTSSEQLLGEEPYSEADTKTVRSLPIGKS